jgi:hypothetical protein
LEVEVNNKMNLAAILFGCICQLSVVNNAGADSFSRTATSGQPKRVAAYHSWDPITCASLAAKVNVVSKPAHGTLTPRVVPHTITVSRYGTVQHCAGTPIKALQIEYKSARGYHGIDTFTLEVTFGWEGRRATDTYTVNVQ